MSTTSFLDLIFIIVLDTVLGVSCYYLSLLVFLWEIFLRALGTQSWTLYMVYLHWYLLVLNGTAPSTFFSLRYFNTDLLWKIKLYIWPCGCLQFLYILHTYSVVIRSFIGVFWNLIHVRIIHHWHASFLFYIHLVLCISTYQQLSVRLVSFVSLQKGWHCLFVALHLQLLPGQMKIPVKPLCSFGFRDRVQPGQTSSVCSLRVSLV